MILLACHCQEIIMFLEKLGGSLASKDKDHIRHETKHTVLRKYHTSLTSTSFGLSTINICNFLINLGLFLS